LDDRPIRLRRRAVDRAVVRAYLLVIFIAFFAVPAGLAWADGPYEPNEIAAQAAGPLLGGVEQFLCVGTGYSLEVAPADDLASVLSDTRDCLRARGSAKAAHVRSARLRAAGKKAHGKRRAELRRRAALEAQVVVVADAAARTACTRPPLTGYPFT
jgi:hypothetical protein